MESKSSTRVSRACLQCRTRHVRCDAVMPVCTRCLNQEKSCSYLKSRRGGRPKKLAPQSATELSELQPAQLSSTSSIDIDFTIPDMDLEYLWNSSLGKAGPIDLDPIVNEDYHIEEAQGAVNSDQLIGLYYEFFHGAHPFVLPSNQFTSRRAQHPESVKLLELVICWIGSLYAPDISSEWHETRIRIELNNTQSQQLIPFNIQALLLYSIGLHWTDQLERSGRILETAICTALQMGMHKLEFSVSFGERDAVLEESWRRTWWQIYITDLIVAASSHLTTWKTSGLDITVELPCEEHEYESGMIPKPRTILDYDNREFAADIGGDSTVGFSSFAHLVGLCRCFDMSLAGGLRTEEDSLSRISRESDAAVAAWHLLLPRSKKELVLKDGKVDELLFKANMLMYTYVVDIHRPLSALAYSTIESSSRCAPPAPPQSLSPARAQESQIHTMKILHAIEKLTDLLTLPTRFTQHTPFVICMIGVTTIAHLSACRHVLSGRDLNVARARVRTAMGALKAYEDIWPLGKRTYLEVGIVARDILSLNMTEGPVLVQKPTDNMEHSWNFYDRSKDVPETLSFISDLEYAPFGLQEDIWM